MKQDLRAKALMFEAQCCDSHSKPAKLEAHLDITQTAKSYNKEEYVCSHGMGVYNVHIITASIL